MSKVDIHWEIAPQIPPEIDKNLGNYSPILRQILNNRGYTSPETARRFIDALPPTGSEPTALLGIQEAVERIIWGINKGELIAIYGDYDVDGVTAAALLIQVFHRLGANIRGYIPDRFSEGYGLNVEALKSLHDESVRLIITVDCGIRSPSEVSYAQELGLDMIITDHHHPGSLLPEAQAIINPKQSGDAYPDKDLAGVGLAYKLACALLNSAKPISFSKGEDHTAEDYLDLVALGTIADLAPLVNENRSLVRKGLQYIQRPHRQGIMSLIGVSQLSAPRISSSHISFALAPRLNAAGRLDSALAALQLLTTEDVSEAAYLAQLLDNQNRERQLITRETQSHAEQLVMEEDPEAFLFIAVDENYNPGVIGLAASRILEKYYRPVIVAAQGEETTRASCRSIPEFHITNALDECADILVKHGGHASAAGFTVLNKDLPELIDRLKSIANRELSALDLRPSLKADAEIPFSELKPDLLHDLAHLQPTGHGNPQATFVTRGVKVSSSRTVGRENAHLKLSVTDGRITFDAIAFRQGHWQEQLPPYIDLLYLFELNEYNGRSSLQLNVLDIKAKGYS